MGGNYCGPKINVKQTDVGALFVEVGIKGHRCALLLDTGASTSVIRPDLTKKYKLTVGPTPWRTLKTAGEGRLNVQGICHVPLTIGRQSINHPFLVTDIRDEGIFGLDILKRLNAHLDLHCSALTIGDKIPLVSRKQSVVGVSQMDESDEAQWIEKSLKSSSLTQGSKEYEAAQSLFQKYKGIFSCTGSTLGRTNVIEHAIDTGTAHPIKQAPRPIPLKRQDEVDKLLNDMISHGVIEPSNSPWASPIVLVPKKDGSTRFCIDYRRLNSVTKKDSYALPTIQAMLDGLGGASWFCTLDLRSGYWQVALKEDAKEKTAFTIYQRGLWQFKVLPFGLCNAPATFQRLMEAVLPPELALVYLDDIIVFGKDFTTVLNKLEQVLKRLASAGLQVRPDKCSFFARETNYLGHIISKDGVRTDPSKTDAVRTWPIPQTKKQVRSFLGMCSYYRRFVKGFSEIARPLNRLTEDKTRFIWTVDCQKSFESLKEAMTSTPVLRYPDLQKPFLLDCDASGHSIGAVLSQEDGDGEKVVAYFSKTLSRPEMNYCTTRRELLAVVRSVEHFHQYLYGSPFTLRTDHASLAWLMSFRNPEGQLARWIETLGAYTYTIIHRKGKHHLNADGLSRRPCQGKCDYCKRREERENHDEILVLKPKVEEENKISQKEDKTIQWVVQQIQQKNRPSPQQIMTMNPRIRQLVARWDSLEVHDDELYHRWEERNKMSRLQWVVPTTSIPEALRTAHSSPTGGHFGFWKTIGKVRQRYYWPGMSSDVKAWCRMCSQCNRVKGPGKKNNAPLQQEIVAAPFDRIGVDILGPFPVTERGNKYVLVVMDYFTKWPEAVPIPNQEAETIAMALVNHVFSRNGVPNEIHTDQGRNFEALVMNEVGTIMGFQRTRTTPLHPQSAGLVERLNRTLTKFLAIFVNENQRDWDDKIPLFLLAYRSAPHTTTGFTPAQLVFGRHLNLPDPLYRKPPHEKPDPSTSYGFWLRDTLEGIHDFALMNSKFKMMAQKEVHDRRAKKPVLSKGDWVWVHDPKRTRGKCPKLQPQWSGPWVIVQKKSDVLFRVKLGCRTRLLHVNRLAKADVRPEGGPDHSGGG